MTGFGLSLRPKEVKASHFVAGPIWSFGGCTFGALRWRLTFKKPQLDRDVDFVLAVCGGNLPLRLSLEQIHLLGKCRTLLFARIGNSKSVGSTDREAAFV